MVKTGIQEPETDEPGFFLVAYSDGMLYYYIAPNYTGGICVLPVDEDADTAAWNLTGSGMEGHIPYDPLGTGPKRAAVVGHYLYYLNWDSINEGRGSFWRKNLKTGEEECLKKGLNWHRDYWRIDKGWIYYQEDGVNKRTRLMGPGSLTEEQVLTDDQILPFSGSLTTILDGEIYTWKEFGPPSIVVSGLNGENERKIFDAAPMWNDQAGKAYARFLESYVPAVFNFETPDYNWGPFFACQDINDDGVRELFVYYGYYRDEYVDYYSYNGLWEKEIWVGKYADQVHINKDAQEIVISCGGDRYSASMERYRLNGDLIQEEVYLWGTADIRGEREFEAAYAAYAEPYPQPNFVENTPENRQKYLLGGEETGWASQ